MDEFSEQYVRACEAQADAMSKKSYRFPMTAGTTDPEGNERTDHDVIARSRLRVDTRKWAMAKLKPKKYGDRNDDFATKCARARR